MRTLIYIFVVTLFSIHQAPAQLSMMHRIVDSDGPANPWAKIIADIDGDGMNDIIIGGQKGPLVWYRYPDWSKHLIIEGGYQTVDGETGDMDNDGDLDVVMGGLFWYENPGPGGDPRSGVWMAHQVADHPTHDVELCDLDRDGDIDIVTRDQSDFGSKAGNRIHLWRQEPRAAWSHRVLECPHGEGLALADLDRDSDKDIVIGGLWFENRGSIMDSAWTAHEFGSWHRSATVASADLNRDGRCDIVLSPSELRGETYKICWFEAPEDPASGPWVEHLIQAETECVIHGLCTGDVDNDGDIDVLFSEMHQGVDPDEVAVMLNNGDGASWSKVVISGMGSHYIRAADIGGDGDLDVMGANWSSDYQPVELWENGAAEWMRISSMTGGLPEPAIGRQVASLIFDVDLDGLNDVLLASYERMMWYRRTASGFQRHAVENGSAGVRLEAGGDVHDIDGDGDLDVLMGAQSSAGEIWWWENPHPDHAAGIPWPRHHALSVGGTHHDQIFGDFDNDNEVECAFWHNRGHRLYLAEIPDDPRGKWPFREIAHFDDDLPRPEGLAAADINLDGALDIVGGGAWFEVKADGEFVTHVIDAEYRFSRSAAGDLIEGGRPEVVISSGDATGPLNLYTWSGGSWQVKTLLPFIDHGHTLQLADFNGDGHLDIYNAEMYRPGPLEACRQMIFYGDGRGGFEMQILSTGLGTHEGKVGDLDGDGDIDILQKDFQQHRRVDFWLNPLK